MGNIQIRPYLESQWLIITGYFKPIMVYFGVWWPTVSSYLAVQVLRACVCQGAPQRTRCSFLGCFQSCPGRPVLRYMERSQIPWIPTRSPLRGPKPVCPLFFKASQQFWALNAQVSGGKGFPVAYTHQGTAIECSMASIHGISKGSWKRGVGLGLD